MTKHTITVQSGYWTAKRFLERIWGFLSFRCILQKVTANRRGLSDAGDAAVDDDAAAAAEPARRRQDAHQVVRQRLGGLVRKQ